MKDFRNLRLKKGTFYVSSKTPADGYKAVNYTDKKTKQEKTIYHLEVPSIEGKLTKIDLTEGLFGHAVRIFVDDDAHINVIDVPLKNPYGRISDYIKSFVQILGNLEPQSTYMIFLNKSNKNNKGIPYKNMVFLNEDKKLVDWAVKPEEFPKINVEIDSLGDKTFDSKERDNFIKDKLISGIENFTEKNKLVDKTVEKEEVVESDDFNELPF